MKKLYKYIGICTLSFLFALSFLPCKILGATHTHTDSCYNGTKHVHDSSCYIDMNAGGCGGDTIKWVETETGTGKCPNCGGTYQYIFYTGTCEKCGKVYTDTKYGECSNCKMVITPITDGTKFPKYPSTKCTYQIDNEELLMLSCDKDETKYYDKDGNLASPMCNQVVVAIEAAKKTQAGTSVDCTLKLTYLDGHTGIANGTSNFDASKEYINSPITITYTGLVGSATNNSSLTTNITMTTPKKNNTQTTTIAPVKPTTIVTQTPTTTNQNNGGNRLTTGNNNSNGNGNNQTIATKPNTSYFSSGTNTNRGNQVAQTNATSTNTPTPSPTPITDIPTKEAVKVTITRPLTEEEKEEKIDGSMVLTKIYRNEVNDTVGVKEKIQNDNTTTKSNIIVNGEVNQGNNTTSKKGKTTLFILLVIICASLGGAGLFIVYKKKQQEADLDTNQISLQDSLRL